LIQLLHQLTLPQLRLILLLRFNQQPQNHLAQIQGTTERHLIRVPFGFWCILRTICSYGRIRCHTHRQHRKVSTGPAEKQQAFVFETTTKI
jgi:hypothetical protein